MTWKQGSPESIVREIKRQTRRKFTAITVCRLMVSPPISIRNNWGIGVSFEQPLSVILSTSGARKALNSSIRSIVVCVGAPGEIDFGVTGSIKEKISSVPL
jgi:hypothetical protein